MTDSFPVVYFRGTLPTNKEARKVPITGGPNICIYIYMGMGQNPVPPVNIPTRLRWVVHLPQNGTIGFDPQPYYLFLSGGGFSSWGL